MPGWRSCLVSTCDLNRDTISRAVTDRVTVISTVTDRDRMIGLDLHINKDVSFYSCIAAFVFRRRSKNSQDSQTYLICLSPTAETSGDENAFESPVAISFISYNNVLHRAKIET
jgi:hypothetical protein